MSDRRVLRVVLATLLGVSAFIVASIADGVQGAARLPSPPLTWVVAGLYLALCQFFVAKKGATVRANWLTLLGMAAPLGVGFIGTLLLENRDTILSQGVPSLLAGCVGPVLGALLAGTWRGRPSGT